MHQVVVYGFPSHSQGIARWLLDGPEECISRHPLCALKKGSGLRDGMFKGGFHTGFNIDLSYFKDHFDFLAIPFCLVPSVPNQ